VERGVLEHPARGDVASVGQRHADVDALLQEPAQQNHGDKRASVCAKKCVQGKKAEKVSYVALTDAVKDPRAVVVKLGHAVVAHATVLGTRWFDEEACGALHVRREKQLVWFVLLHRELVVVACYDAGIAEATHGPDAKAQHEKRDGEGFERRVDKEMVFVDERPAVCEENRESAEHKC
jgi:hypothetical protein